MNGRAGRVANLDVPGDKVGMEVRKEDVADRQAMAIRLIPVLLCVASWIDNDRRAGLLVADEIRRMRETIEIELFENHFRSSEVPGSGFRFRGSGTGTGTEPIHRSTGAPTRFPHSVHDPS